MPKKSKNPDIVAKAKLIVDGLKAGDECFLADLAEEHGPEVCNEVIDLLYDRKLDVYDGIIVTEEEVNVKLNMRRGYN